MSIGFKVQNISSKKRIADIIKTDYFLKDGQVRDYSARHRDHHFRMHYGVDKDFPCTLQELYLPSEDRFIASYDVTTTPGGKPIYTLFCQTKGFWKVRVIKSSVNDLIDFTISVLVGNKWRYYPSAIKRHIVTHHGVDAYETWRELVLGDLGSLRELLSAVKLKEYAYSATCCDSAKRLCQRVGLEVVNDIAFILPTQQ